MIHVSSLSKLILSKPDRGKVINFLYDWLERRHIFFSLSGVKYFIYISIIHIVNPQKEFFFEKMIK